MSRIKKLFSSGQLSSEVLFDAPKHVGVIMDGNGRWAKVVVNHVLWVISLLLKL